MTKRKRLFVLLSFFVRVLNTFTAYDSYFTVSFRSGLLKRNSRNMYIQFMNLKIER